MRFDVLTAVVTPCSSSRFPLQDSDQGLSITNQEWLTTTLEAFYSFTDLKTAKASVCYNSNVQLMLKGLQVFLLFVCLGSVLYVCSSAGLCVKTNNTLHLAFLHPAFSYAIQINQQETTFYDLTWIIAQGASRSVGCAGKL
jgi:hypothetical protein